MREKIGKPLLLFAAAAAVLIGLDQWTKWLAVLHLNNAAPVPVIDGVFELVYSVNYGAAFGILQNRQTLFYIITPIVLFLVLFFYCRIPGGKRYIPLRLICILLFSGAAGNFIDRVTQQYVVDFLYFRLIDFPVFNVADCYVTVAAALLFIFILFVYKEEELNVLFTFSRKGKTD